MIIALIVYLALLALTAIVVFPALIVGARADQHLVEGDLGEPESLASLPDAASRRIAASA
jgi:hypothetical protein